MFGQSKVKNSEPFHAVVSAHMFVDEKGAIDVEVLDFIHDDYDQSDIFCDIEYTLRDYIDFGDKKEHFFMAYVKGWFHSYYDYFDGFQCEAEFEVTELKTINDFKNINLSKQRSK